MSEIAGSFDEGNGYILVSEGDSYEIEVMSLSVGPGNRLPF
jgi:hypothetical protein